MAAGDVLRSGIARKLVEFFGGWTKDAAALFVVADGEVSAGRLSNEQTPSALVLHLRLVQEKEQAARDRVKLMGEVLVLRGMRATVADGPVPRRERWNGTPEGFTLRVCKELWSTRAPIPR